MGAEMNVKSEINCKLDLSPNTVLPPLQQYSKGVSSYAKASLRKDELLRVKDGFTEISFRRYRSASCKNARYKSLGLDGHVELKRGSVYKSSKEIRKWTKTGTDEGRRKIEVSHGSFTPFSPTIVDSLCGSDEDIPNVPSITKHNKEPFPTDGFIEICPNMDNRRQESGHHVEEDTTDNKIGCKPTACSRNQEITLPKKDRVSTLHQSLPAMVEVLHSPSSSESGRSFQPNPRTRFSPIRKMFDPLRKSKSLRGPSGYGAKALDVTISGMDDMRRCKTLKKSLLPDFLNTAQGPQLNNQCINRDPYCSVVASSPVHLHGRLKLQNKNGHLLFEFSMNQPEDLLVAKTWKREKAFNWVYTFHSVSCRKSSNAGTLNSNGSRKKSLVGQMQVSCYLCSEVKSNGAFWDSLVTEFVLYDIAHARKCVSPRQSDDGSDPVKVETRSDAVSGDSDFISSNESIQRPSINPDPSLETAAIAIQVPVVKRESLKYRREEKGGENGGSDSINFSWVDEGKKVCKDNETHELRVVIPAGFHGLPSTKSPGPSSLLDRWRLGGGCDCGGWDMACPLVVLGNPSIKCSDDRPYVNARRPFQLFLQGTKDSLPALTMTSIGEGEYAIDFHAQLSSLQAFSICVAVLHGNEASAAAMKEEGVEFTRSNTLEKLLQEEVNFLIKAVTEEKKKLIKKVDEVPASFMLNPPFSPIARV